MSRILRSLAPCLAASLLLAVMFACGGGGGGGSETPAAEGPTITAQPQDQSVEEGQAATFRVTATPPGALSYQWRKNGTVVPGAIEASYTTPATTISDHGSVFSVVVSSGGASRTSNGAALAVTASDKAPQITQHPQNRTVALGQTATFSVTATGIGSLSYQWRKNGTAISGATSSSYTTPATTLGDSGSTFSVVVTCVGLSTVSGNATLTVSVAPPSISFDASPGAITPAGFSTLSWTTSNATSVTINQGIGTVALSGSRSVSPSATTTYTLTATGAGGTRTAAATVTIVANANLLVDFGKTPAENLYGVSGWNTPVASSTVAGVQSASGVAGLTQTSGSGNYSAWYGVKGPSRSFVEGERIVMTWHLTSGTIGTFRPVISFTDENQPVNASGEPDWYVMNNGYSVSNAHGTFQTWFIIKDVPAVPTSIGHWSVVNVAPVLADSTVLNKLIIDRIELFPPADLRPAAPASVGSSVQENAITLTWTPSTSQHFPVKKYWIYRNGMRWGSTYDDADPTHTTFTDYMTCPDTAYEYAVSAVDALGNESVLSGSIWATSGSMPVQTLVNPKTDLTYLGAFTLPTEWAYSVLATTFYPKGDGGKGSIFGFKTHTDPAGFTALAEISIPVPKISAAKQTSELNRAASLQPFKNVFCFTPSGNDKIAGIAYVPKQGSGSEDFLYYSFAGNHDMAKSLSHGRSRMNFSTPDSKGGWYVGSAGSPGDPPYLTYNDTMFKLPDAFASVYTNGKLLGAAQFREGWGTDNNGISFMAVGLPNGFDGVPPASGGSLTHQWLLKYDASLGKRLQGWLHYDMRLMGGTWIDLTGKKAIVFATNKAVHEAGYNKSLYDLNNGETESTYAYHVPSLDPTGGKGASSTDKRCMLLFYDPGDIEDVAAGRKQRWEPQPYAWIDLTEYMYRSNEVTHPYFEGLPSYINRRKRISGMAFDEAWGRLYIFESYGENSVRPIAHIFQVSDAP